MDTSLENVELYVSFLWEFFFCIILVFHGLLLFYIWNTPVLSEQSLQLLPM